MLIFKFSLRGISLYGVFPGDCFHGLISQNHFSGVILLIDLKCRSHRMIEVEGRVGQNAGWARLGGPVPTDSQSSSVSR